MFAKTSSPCEGCGNPVIVANKTPVRYDKGKIVACYECEPELLDAPESDDLVEVKVRVIRQTWMKPDESWAIYKVERAPGSAQKNLPDGANGVFALCGPVGAWNQGDVISVIGQFETTAKYGFQLTAKARGTLDIYESEAAMVSFLARNIDETDTTRAKKIVRHFGGCKETLAILDLGASEASLRLQEVQGIGQTTADTIKSSYDLQSGFREFRLWAAKLGLTDRIVAMAVEAWGDEAKQTIEDDPFELMDFPKIGFKTCDDIHGRLARDPKHPSRCAAGVLQCLKRNDEEGHTWILESELKSSTIGRIGDQIRIIRMTPEEVEIGLVLLEKERQVRRRGQTQYIPPKIVREDGRVFLYSIHRAEKVIAKELARLVSASIVEHAYLPKVWGSMTPSLEQEDAVKLALKTPVSLLLGQPGTGKSQTTRAVLDALEASGHRLLLAAPTGKATMRMTELTGRKASTIHRLLAYKETSADELRFEETVIVCDEVSMCSAVLFADLLECIKTGARLICVGDPNQLPSIDSGSVLEDMIDSNLIPKTTLTRIFRQESDGDSKRIPEFARDINKGITPDLVKKNTDVVFLEMNDDELIAQKIILAVSRQIPEKYGLEPKDIQVISPQKGDVDKKSWTLGTTSLNIRLQEALNPPKNGPQEGAVDIGAGYIARANDRVIHCRNNYDLMTMNGEQATVLAVNKKGIERKTLDAHPLMITSAKTTEAKNVTRKKKTHLPVILIADYGDRVVGYNAEECKELQLAYALTCHRMQGSQSKAVVLPVDKSHDFMHTRKLFYVAVTRAEQYVLILGQTRQIAKAVKNTRGDERRTMLIERLQDAFVDVVDASTSTTILDIPSV